MEFLAEPPQLQSYVISFNVYRQDRYSILGFKLVDGATNRQRPRTDVSSGSAYRKMR